MTSVDNQINNISYLTKSRSHMLKLPTSLNKQKSSSKLNLKENGSKERSLPKLKKNYKSNLNIIRSRNNAIIFEKRDY